MLKRFHLYFFIPTFLMTVFCSIGHTDANLLRRKEVQAFIDNMVQTHHFKRQDLVQLFAKVQLQPKIIEAITRPYEKKTWDVYSQLF